MKGMEFNLILVIIVLAILLLIGITGFFFIKNVDINSYISPEFKPCGESDGSFCCNLDDSGLEPFCISGLKCIIQGDPLMDVNNYKKSMCRKVTNSLFIDPTPYIYDASCTNNLDSSKKSCESTLVTKTFLLDDIFKKGKGIGEIVGGAAGTDLRLGQENCENVYSCQDCKLYYGGIIEPKDCGYCELCDETTGNCTDCLDCNKASDAEYREYTDCHFCYDCSECTEDSEGIKKCEDCSNCETCYESTRPSSEKYCRESDICNSTQCFNNFFCGDDKASVDENVYCSLCKPSSAVTPAAAPATVCEKESEYAICDQIKNCLKDHKDASDSCTLVEDYIPLSLDSNIDISSEFSSYIYMNELTDNLNNIISMCQAEDLYAGRNYQGIEQRICRFEPKKLNLITDASQLPTFLSDESGAFIAPPMLPNTNDDTDLSEQDRVVTLNDCGNMMMASPANYFYSKSNDPKFNDLLLYNDGEFFKSSTMPNGRIINIMLSDMSFFNNESENICDYNVYMCSQRMLADASNPEPANLYVSMMNVISSPFVVDLSKVYINGFEISEKIPIDQYDKSLYDMRGDVGNEYRIDSYLMSFNDIDEPTFTVDIGSKPIDSGHIANIIVSAARDWSLMISSDISEPYANLKTAICDKIEGQPDVNLCKARIKYDYFSEWNLTEIDYNNLPELCKSSFTAYSNNLRTGGFEYKTCSNDLINGGCSQGAIDSGHPCWGFCNDHQYTIDQGGSFAVKYTTGRTKDCVSKQTFELLDGSSSMWKSVSDDKKSYTTHTYSTYPGEGDWDIFKISDSTCYIDSSELCVAHSTLKGSVNLKKIYITKTASGKFSGNIKVSVGYIVNKINDETDSMTYMVHPIIKVVQG